MNLEAGGALLKFGVWVNGVLASKVSMRHIVQPRFQRRDSVERRPGVIDGRRQSLGVLTGGLYHGRPASPHRLDVGLQSPGKQRVGMRPQHRRHGHDAVDGRLHCADIVLYALTTHKSPVSVRNMKVIILNSAQCVISLSGIILFTRILLPVLCYFSAHYTTASNCCLSRLWRHLMRRWRHKSTIDSDTYLADS